MEWAKVAKGRFEAGKVGTIPVVGPPDPSYTIRRKE